MFGVFVAYPAIETIQLSLFDWDGVSPTRDFVGLDNFRELVSDDPFFWTAVRNTAIWGAVTIPVQIGLGLALALLLDRKLRFRAFYRSAFFLPAVLSSVVIAAVWGWIYNPEFGLANKVIGWFGIGGRDWLGDPDLALWSAMLVSVWRWAGLNMVFFLAALQTIPTDLYEAARIDGSSALAQIRHITIPLLKPMTALLVLLGAIGALRDFEIVYILTGGGPAHASDLVSLQIFDQGFTLSRSGYAAAIAVLLLVVTVAIAAVLLRSVSRATKEVSS